MIDPSRKPSNPRYSDETGQKILLTVGLLEYPGDHTYCARPDDYVQLGRDLFALAQSGEFGPVAPYVPPAPGP